MLIKGNVLPDEHNKMETSGFGNTKIVFSWNSVKIVRTK